MCSLNHWTIREVPRSFSVQTNSSKYKEIRASQVALVVRNLPANAGDLRDAGLIPGLGRAPGGGHGTHSRILAWRIPYTEEPGGLQSMGSQRVVHD